MPYYASGDLANYIFRDFYNISWKAKLENLKDLITGLNNLHNVNIIHKNLHSGNIFFNYTNVANVVIGGLDISKSAIDTDDNDNENYGTIPYMAPEIFQGQKYTKASDVYSFGMIMWEFMTGTRPFWDRIHDAELIIEIYDGLRPPIVTNAPEGYIDLMKECWHSDPNKRPTAVEIFEKIDEMRWKERWSNTDEITKIIESSDIGPVKNNPGAIYKSRHISCMVQSAMSTRSLRSQSITSEICR